MMTLIFWLLATASAQTCTVTQVVTQMMCDYDGDGIHETEVTPNAGAFDVSGVCPDPAMTGSTGDTGVTVNPIVEDTATTGDTAQSPDPRCKADEPDCYIWTPEPGIYTPGDNTVLIMGQSLCLGSASPQEPWWDSSDTGLVLDTGLDWVDSAPPMVGQLYKQAGGGSVSDWSQHLPWGPEIGLLAGTEAFSPPLQVHKLCVGSTSIYDWIHSTDHQSGIPFLYRWVFNRSDQIQERPQDTWRGYPREAIWVQGTQEAKFADEAARYYMDLGTLQNHLEIRFTDGQTPFKLWVDITEGDPAVLPYLAEVEAATRQRAAEDPSRFGVIETRVADGGPPIYPDELLADGKHISTRGSYLLGVEGARLLASSPNYLTTP